jgi:uncharacterized protein DUF763
VRSTRTAWDRHCLGDETLDSYLEFCDGCENAAFELLRRLAHPFWFQSFGAVMGMDWHSSGITTSVIGALKRGLKPLEHELGLHVCGGRGKHSRNTPEELVSIGDRVGLTARRLPPRAASLPRSTAPPSRMASTFTYTASSWQTMDIGSLFSRA